MEYLNKSLCGLILSSSLLTSCKTNYNQNINNNFQKNYDFYLSVEINANQEPKKEILNSRDYNLASNLCGYFTTNEHNNFNKALAIGMYISDNGTPFFQFENERLVIIETKNKINFH